MEDTKQRKNARKLLWYYNSQTLRMELAFLGIYLIFLALFVHVTAREQQMENGLSILEFYMLWHATFAISIVVLSFSLILLLLRKTKNIIVQQVLSTVNFIGHLILNVAVSNTL